MDLFKVSYDYLNANGYLTTKKQTFDKLQDAIKFIKELSYDKKFGKPILERI